MAWDRSAPVNPKYRTREHREYCASLKRDLKRDGYLICTANPCLFETRAITNPNGNARDGLTAGHHADGVTYAGPQHRACNVRDGAVRARARQINEDETPWYTVTCVTCGSDIYTRYPGTRYCIGGGCTPKRKPRATPIPPTCPDCGQRVSRRGARCQTCGAEANRVAMRNAYRQRVGIPIDAPLAKGGRPRRWDL